MMTNDSAAPDPEQDVVRLKQRAERATARPFDLHTFDLLPPTWETEYWRAVMHACTGATQSPRALLEAGEFVLAPESTLDDETLTVRLWQVIRRLQHLNIFLTATNHLNDRELYRWLREEALTQFVVLSPGSPHNYALIHVISNGDEQDFELWAKYYMAPDERERWLSENPDETLPDTCKPPFDRDRHLPCFIPHIDHDDSSEDLSWMEEFDDDDEPEDGDEWKRL